LKKNLDAALLLPSIPAGEKPTIRQQSWGHPLNKTVPMGEKMIWMEEGVDKVHSAEVN
jgi:hypothetical protein